MVNPFWKTAIFQKAKHRITIQCHNSTTSYQLKINENIYPYKNIHKCLIATLFLTEKKVETTQISIDKQNEYYLAIKQNEVLMHTIT